LAADALLAAAKMSIRIEAMSSSCHALYVLVRMISLRF
jgi:hypothetical protein